MSLRKFFRFTLILGFSDELWRDLHHIFTSLCCQRGVTRHPNNPPSDAYADFVDFYDIVFKTSISHDKTDLCNRPFDKFLHFIGTFKYKML